MLEASFASSPARFRLSDIIKRLTEGKEDAKHAPISEPVAKIIEAGSAAPEDEVLPAAVEGLLNALPLAPPEKQQGSLKVGIVTPYACTDVKALIGGLRFVEKTYSRVGTVFHEGSEAIGYHLPRYLPQHTIVHMVRDHPDYTKHHKHLGGSGRWADAGEEIRCALAESGRLLRRHATDAIDDLLDKVHVLVAAPACARSSYAMATARRLNIPCYMAASDTPELFMNDIEPPEPRLLVVTPPDFADVDRLTAAEFQFRVMKGIPLAAVYLTASPAARQVMARALSPDEPLHLVLAETGCGADRLIALAPDIVAVTPGHVLSEAVKAFAEAKKIPVVTL